MASPWASRGRYTSTSVELAGTHVERLPLAVLQDGGGNGQDDLPLRAVGLLAAPRGRPEGMVGRRGLGERVGHLLGVERAGLLERVRDPLRGRVGFPHRPGRRLAVLLLVPVGEL